MSLPDPGPSAPARPEPHGARSEAEPGVSAAPGHAGLPLEPSPEEMLRAGEEAVRLVVEAIRGLPDAAASDLEGFADAVRALREPLPESGSELRPLLDVVRNGAGKGFNTAGPGYLAFIPGGGIYSAALAEFVAYGLNRFVNLWSAAPILAQMEATVVRWLADLFDLPADARGLLTTGGSMANLSAVVAARRALLPPDFLSGTLYASDQAHASVAKAAVLAGFPPERVRVVPTTPDLRMDPDALARMLAEDRSAGLRPFCVVANGGTTNTGAIDPLPGLAELCRREGLWLHVDAAYGGFFQLTERGRARLSGIELADSITLDPHKGLFLPYGTGSLLVRDGRRLLEAHRVTGEYLRDLADEGEIPNFTDYSPELSRDFRGLRVWLPLKLHGAAAFREALDEKLDLTAFLHRELAAEPRFELPWEPELSIVAFRVVPPRGDPEAFNRALLGRINASRRVFMSSTTIGGRSFIRACILSFRTHRDRVEEAAQVIRRSARELLEG